MKININATLENTDIIEHFIKYLKQNNIEAHPENIKFLVTGKDGKDVEITPDRLRVIFRKE